ncbi:hypothetical protein CI102_4731 [Trichoderma harzianum]|nr:hypothetical protein CI102_4731 [Trichoderma harzianum]
MFGISSESASSKQSLTPSSKKKGICGDNYMPPAPTLRHSDYTIGWIYALHNEMAAARAMLAILGHRTSFWHVCLFSAANVASNIHVDNLPIDLRRVEPTGIRSFSSIRTRLMVGIGGGVPGSNIDHRLVRITVPKMTPLDHSSYVSSLRAIHEIKPSKIPHIFQEMHDKSPERNKHDYPNSSPDWLFRAAY